MPYPVEVASRKRFRTHTPGHPGIGPGSRGSHNYHITYEHEAEAKAVQRAKKPSRIGLFVLKLLGYRDPAQHVPDVPREAPSHQHPRRRHD